MTATNAMPKAKATEQAVPAANAKAKSALPPVQSLTGFISTGFRSVPHLMSRALKMAVHLIDTRPGSHIQEVCQAAMETSAVFIVMGSPDYGEATRDNMAHTRWELSCWR